MSQEAMLGELAQGWSLGLQPESTESVQAGKESSGSRRGLGPASKTIHVACAPTVYLFSCRNRRQDAQLRDPRCEIDLHVV